MKFLAILLCVLFVVSDGAPIPSENQQVIHIDRLQIAQNTFGDILTIGASLNADIKSQITQKLANVIVGMINNPEKFQQKETIVVTPDASQMKFVANLLNSIKK